MAQVVETSSNPVIDYYSLALAVPPTDLRFKEWYVLRDKNCTIAGYNVPSEILFLADSLETTL